MDLNEKIAARRRELGVEAENNKIEAKAKMKLELPNRLEEQVPDEKSIAISRCRRCGNEISSTTIICGNCGCKVKDWSTYQTIIGSDKKTNKYNPIWGVILLFIGLFSGHTVAIFLGLGLAIFAVLANISVVKK